MSILSRSSLLIGIALVALFLSSAIQNTFISKVHSDKNMNEDYYTEQWKKVDEAIGKGLPKSALQIVEEIYARAKADKNKPQIIKSIAYRVALAAETNEEGEVILIRDIENEIASSQHPVKAILQSILADIYWRYYQMNRWKIGSRTLVEDKAESDFRTWDAAKFFDTTRALYLKSLESASELQKIPVSEYKEILIQRSTSELYRPTLYDILAHRALEFFENDETNLPKPTQEFELTTLDALMTAKEFGSQKFETPDENDPKFITVKLYQQLLLFHLVDSTHDALVDLDLQRLKFARAKTFHEDKDTTYFMALQKLSHEFSEESISSQIIFEIAQYYYDNGDFVKSLETCEQGKNRFRGSRGAQNCESLQSTIFTKEINLAVEQTILPESPFIISTSYRNIEKVYCRIVEIDDTEDEDDYYYRRSTEEWLTDVLKKNPVQTWSQNLPVVKDYKHHRVEVKGPATKLGKYILLMSAAENFSLEKNAIAFTRLYATRLSLQNQQRADGNIVCWVHDAENGKPLEGVTVNLFVRNWESGRNKYVRDFIRKLTTDKNGSFTLSAGSYRDQIFLKLKLRNDEYSVGQAFNPYQRGKSGEHYQTLFFTDRSLYRPGQTIYFKGIILKANPEDVKYAVAPKMATTVTFMDVNYQKISEQKFTTNEYGSFNGSFTAPSGVLTGTMTIRNEWGGQTIRVEEYKRPKFEVQFQPIKGSFRLNETIKTKGTAKAYAGSNIDGAQVKYRIVRQPRFPYWYWWWRPFPISEAKEIAHGTTKTNDAGEFEINFVALPDKSISKKELPVFDYTVTADVTDINGETRSGSTSISIGYTSLSLSVKVKDVIETSEKSPIAITSTNLNGEPVKASGSIRIEKLHAPKRILRSRFFEAPDQFALSEDEFIKSFPHDEYKNESNQDSWKSERSVLNSSFNTNEKGQDSIRINDLPQGRYRILTSTKDPSGEEIIIKTFFTVFDKTSKALPIPKTAMYIPIKIDCQPSETASFIWGTSYDNARILYQIEHRNVIIKEEWMTLNNEQRRFEIPIKEEYRGGISVHISMVRAYRLYTENIFINVPWTNKDLHIETATFRDKLKPGQLEEWRITIKGEKAEKVAAEMVATMYDASLDAIWSSPRNTFSWHTFHSYARTKNHTFGWLSSMQYGKDWNEIKPSYNQEYDELNLFILSRGRYYWGRGFYGRMKDGGEHETNLMAAPMATEGISYRMDGISSDSKSKKDGKGETVAGVPTPPPTKQAPEMSQIKARTNFNETAFFFPQLMTNENGDVILKFTVPEALTRWRMIAFAHTPDLKIGSIEKSAVTQKEIMVMPNAPRFLREDDEIIFPIKIVNKSGKTMNGTAKLMLFDAVTMQPIDAKFKLINAQQNFSIEKDRSTSVSWKLFVPENISAIVYRVVAQSGEFSDGEEAPLPVLPNRMLVTESLPLNVRGNQTRTYTFDKLIHANESSTLRHYKLSLEMTSNPAWYAIQALPYMMEFPYECSEQVFNRFYSNSIASHLVNSNPKIKRVFDQWKGTDALLSNLEKNQELKSLLLQETPWVMQSQNESERKKRVALLFDLNTMSNNLDNAIRKLEKAQGSNGGFPWFPGMPESRYITQYIIAGFGHLKTLGIATDDARINQIVERAIQYTDRKMNNDYQELKRRTDFNPAKDYLNYLEVQYLYARSYFLNQKINKEYQEAVDFWLSQSRKFWVPRNFMMQGMIALSLKRFDDKKTPNDIIASLRERSLQSDEMGMYWKQEGGWFWYQAPIETQALLIEAFDEIANDQHAIDEMKIWLLKQKQVQDWKTTVATAEACYALLRRGSDFLASDKIVEVSIGNVKVDPQKDGGKIEAGTGYYKVSWNASDIKPEMGKVTVTKKDDGIAWGAVYWQYFEQLDKITPHKTPLQIDKKLYRQNTTDKGIVLEPITENNMLHVGDILKVRIEIRVDRDMEYIHLKDMRGAGLDLINQLSTYKWQGGLGYYEAPKDASVNFFIHWLPKGVYVFEYPLRVSHAGTFSNGITTIQSMYAPEFASHTQGVVVKVK